MKALIVLVLGLLAAGCGEVAEVAHKSLQPKKKTDQITTKAEPAKEPTPTDQNTTVAWELVTIKAKPVKELTLEEKKVVGQYGLRADGNTLKQVLLDNGIYEHHFNGEKQLEGKWSISNGKIHIDYDNGYLSVIRINEDKSITQISEIVDGKRRDHPKEGHTFKKIK